MAEESYILALDATTTQGTVALFADGELLGQLVYRKPKAHARLMAPMIDTLLRDMDIAAQSLDAVCVLSGPGSYTGLRVVTSTAKGLCLATGAKLLHITSLQMLAWAASGIAAKLGAQILPLIDARRMEAYGQLFGPQGDAIAEPAAILLESYDWESQLSGKPLVLIGDAVEKTIPLLTSFSHVYPFPAWPQGLAHIGQHIQKMYNQAQFASVVHFEPFYLKSVRITQKGKPAS